VLRRNDPRSTAVLPELPRRLRLVPVDTAPLFAFLTDVSALGVGQAPFAGGIRIVGEGEDEPPEHDLHDDPIDTTKAWRCHRCGGEFDSQAGARRVPCVGRS